VGWKIRSCSGAFMDLRGGAEFATRVERAFGRGMWQTYRLAGFDGNSQIAAEGSLCPIWRNGRAGLCKLDERPRR
jgi:hypothetical protein